MEALAQAGEIFDVVLAMEVVEHVADVGLFVELAAGTVKPGGLMFVATLNRTAKSFALAIVGAEYILRWLPRGTHQWDKFVMPDELEIAIEQGGLRIIGETGVIYNVFADRWQLSSRHGRELHGGRGEGGVMATPWLWAVFTVIAAFAQTLRNAMQRELTDKPRHRRRDPCALSVRPAVRADFSDRRTDCDTRGAAKARADFLALGDRWRAARRSPPPR